MNMSNLKLFLVATLVIYVGAVLIWTVQIHNAENRYPMNVVEVHSNKCGCVRGYVPGGSDVGCYLKVRWKDNNTLEVLEEGLTWWHWKPLKMGTEIKTDVYRVHVYNYTVWMDNDGYVLVNVYETVYYDPRTALVKSLVLETVLYLTVLFTWAIAELLF